MSKIKVLFFLIYFSSLVLYAQQYNRPGTVLKDTLFNRYLVSNYEGTNVLQLSRAGTLNYFINGLKNPVGMVIVDSILYLVDNQRYIKGFQLKDARKVFQIKIPESAQLCGLTSDRKGLLYCTDIDKNKLFKISYLDSSYQVIGDVTNGSDLEFDFKNRRLLIVTYNVNAGVYEYLFDKERIDTLFLIPKGYGTCDGLEIDRFGNIYTSSWDKDAIVYYNQRDGYKPHILAPNQFDPVYMLVDEKERNMLVPCMANNKVNIIDLANFFAEQESLFTGTPKLINSLPANFYLEQNYPNPFNPSTTIGYSIPDESNVIITIYNPVGELITELTKGIKHAGYYHETFDAGSMSSGVYYYAISVQSLYGAKNYTNVKKMILLK